MQGSSRAAGPTGRSPGSLAQAPPEAFGSPRALQCGTGGGHARFAWDSAGSAGQARGLWQFSCTLCSPQQADRRGSMAAAQGRMLAGLRLMPRRLTCSAGHRCRHGCKGAPPRTVTLAGWSASPPAVGVWLSITAAAGGVLEGGRAAKIAAAAGAGQAGGEGGLLHIPLRCTAPRPLIPLLPLPPQAPAAASAGAGLRAAPT